MRMHISASPGRSTASCRNEREREKGVLPRRIIIPLDGTRRRWSCRPSRLLPPLRTFPPSSSAPLPWEWRDPALPGSREAQEGSRKERREGQEGEEGLASGPTDPSCSPTSPSSWSDQHRLPSIFGGLSGPRVPCPGRSPFFFRFGEYIIIY